MPPLPRHTSSTLRRTSFSSTAVEDVNDSSSINCRVVSNDKLSSLNYIKRIQITCPAPCPCRNSIMKEISHQSTPHSSLGCCSLCLRISWRISSSSSSSSKKSDMLSILLLWWKSKILIKTSVTTTQPTDTHAAAVGEWINAYLHVIMTNYVIKAIFTLLNFESPASTRRLCTLPQFQLLILSHLHLKSPHAQAHHRHSSAFRRHGSTLTSHPFILSFLIIITHSFNAYLSKASLTFSSLLRLYNIILCSFPCGSCEWAVQGYDNKRTPGWWFTSTSFLKNKMTHTQQPPHHSYEFIR